VLAEQHMQREPARVPGSGACARDRGDQIDKEGVVELGEEKQNPTSPTPARSDLPFAPHNPINVCT
jgi:hypothetical protein